MPTSEELAKDSIVRRLIAGDLEAVFLPQRGMLGASLRHHGAEILRRVQDLESAAAKGSTAGIPLLHPWANRLAGPEYHAAGRSVHLDLSSPLLHLDGNRLPIHGVPWSLLAWEVIRANDDSLAARFDWSRPDLLAVFPFRHQMEIVAMLGSEGLTIETTLIAGAEGPVPVSFGFHPYLGVPGLPREQWRLKLPAMRRLPADSRGIPTGQEQPFEGFDAALGERVFDDGFVLLDERASFSLAGAGRRITIELLSGYRYAQVFAPRGSDCVALEPMTAPTSSLTTGRGLRLVEPGARFHAAFRIRLEAIA